MKYENLDYKDELEDIFKELKENDSVFLNYYISSKCKFFDEITDEFIIYDEDSAEYKEVEKKYRNSVNFLSLYNLVTIDTLSTVERTHKFSEVAIFDSFKEWFDFVNQKAQRELELINSTINSNISSNLTNEISQKLTKLTVGLFK